MKNKAWVVALAAAVILAASAGPARAGFYIGVRGGSASQDVTLKGGLRDISFDRNSSFLYGGQVGFKLLALAVEGEFYRAGYNLLSSDASIPASGVDMGYSYLGVNGKLGIPLVIVYPYITVGYGKYSADLTGFGKGSDTGFNVGAGAELELGKVGLFGELRYKDFSFDLNNLDWAFKGIEVHFGLNVHI